MIQDILRDRRISSVLYELVHRHRSPAHRLHEPGVESQEMQVVEPLPEPLTRQAGLGKKDG
jgi:hypothetical protein